MNLAQKTSKFRKNENTTSQETVTLKGIGKQQVSILVTQMVNFSKLYANVEGCAVADCSINRARGFSSEVFVSI